MTSVAMFTGVLPGRWLYFDERLLFKMPPEIWRLVTSFLITKPKFGLIMDTYFLYQNLSQLETLNPKFSKKEDVLWYLITVGAFILVSASELSLGIRSAFPPHSIQHDFSQKGSGLENVPLEYLPA